MALLFNLLGNLGVTGANDAIAALVRFQEAAERAAQGAERAAERTTRAGRRTRQSTQEAGQGAEAAGRQAEQAERRFRGAGEALEGLGRTGRQTGTILESLFSAEMLGYMRQGTNYLVNAGIQYQGFQRSLQATTGSAEKMREVMKQISEYADKTPFDTDKLKEVATKFSTMKQDVKANLELTAKLAYLHNAPIDNTGDIIAQANAGDINVRRRLKTNFGFTASMARDYGAVVRRGAIVVGDRGSEENDRLMGALRAYVADREKGLPGGVFGQKGLSQAISNVRSGGFLTAASFADKITPDLIKVSDVARSGLDWLRDLPDWIQTAIARFVVFTGSIKAFSLAWGLIRPLLTGMVSPLAQVGRGLLVMASSAANATSAAAGMVTGLGAVGVALGAAGVVYAAASVGLELYSQHLKTLNAELDLAAKRQSELSKVTHTATDQIVRAGGGGLLDRTGYLKANLSKTQTDAVVDQLQTEIEALRERKRQAEEDYNLAYTSKHWGSKQGADYRPGLDKALAPFDRMIAQRSSASLSAQTAFVSNTFMGMYAEISKNLSGQSGQAGGRPARLSPEIQDDYEKLTLLRSYNEGPRGKGYTKALADLAGDANSALIAAQKDKARTHLTDAGINASDAARIAEAVINAKDDQGAKDVLSKAKVTGATADSVLGVYRGEQNDPTQVKFLATLRKELNAAKQQEVEIDLERIRNAEKIAEIEKRSTPEDRIKLIDKERQAVQDMMDAKIISADEGEKRLNQLSVTRAQEVQRQKDAQRDLNIELKRLYGDDTGAQLAELEKRKIEMKATGASAVQIEKYASSERRKIWADDAQKAIQAEQQIADARSNRENKKNQTAQSKAQGRIARGDSSATGDLIALQKSQLDADLKKVDADTVRRKQELTAKLQRTDLSPHERSALQDELNSLGANAATEKDRLRTEFASKSRDEATSQRKTNADSQAQLGDAMRTRLTMIQEQGGGSYQQKLMNLRLQLDLEKSILQTKYETMMAEKDLDPTAKKALALELSNKIMEAERNSYNAAKQLTEEYGKQSAAQDELAQKKHNADPRYSATDTGSNLSSGTSFSGFGAFGEGFGKAVYSETPRNLNAALGIDPTARRNALDPANIARLGAKGAASALTSAGADAKTKGLQIYGEAKLTIEVINDGRTTKGKMSAPLKRQTSEQNTDVPLGGA